MPRTPDKQHEVYFYDDIGLQFYKNVLQFAAHLGTLQQRLFSHQCSQDYSNQNMLVTITFLQQPLSTPN